MDDPTDYLMAAYALNLPYDLINRMCYVTGVYPRFIKLNDVRDWSKSHIFIYTREIDPSDSGLDVVFTKIYVYSIIGVAENILKVLKYHSDDYNYIALDIVIEECAADLRLVKYYKFVSSEINKSNSMDRLLKMLYSIDKEVCTVHPKNYDMSGSNPKDTFRRYWATQLYEEAMEVYIDISVDNKSRPIVVDSPFSDKMKLFLQVLHYTHPEWECVNYLLENIPFAGIQESNYTETVKLIEADKKNSVGDDDNDEWFYRFSMK